MTAIQDELVHLGVLFPTDSRPKCGSGSPADSVSGGESDVTCVACMRAVLSEVRNNLADIVYGRIVLRDGKAVLIDSSGRASECFRPLDVATAQTAEERQAAVAYIRREAANMPTSMNDRAIVLESIADMLEEAEHHAQVFAPKVGDYVRVRWAPKGLTRTMGCVVEVTPAGVRVDHGGGEVYGWALGEVCNARWPEAMIDVLEDIARKAGHL